MTEGRSMATCAAALTGLLALWAATLGHPLFAGPHDAAVEIAGVAISQRAAFNWPWALGLYLGGIGALFVLRARGATSPAAVVPMILAAAGFLVGARLQFRLEALPFGQALAMPLAGIFEPGMREPLGIVLAAVFACSAAALLRVPWRAMGDAVAVTLAAMMPFGRIACLIVGCCAGRVASPRFAWLAARYPRGTEAHATQVAQGLIDATSPFSLPTHPLPLYFALAGLALLALLVRLLRRGAASGSLLLTFGFVWPVVKLSLEQLRADPRPGMLMTLIPSAVLVVALAVLGTTVRRPTRGPALERPIRLGPAAPGNA
jgi:phosphatidylglycerol:prolipoprotein diacylglycerol transferase